MKIEFTAKKIKLTRVAIALVAISLAGYVAYAATSLSISNSGSVTIANKNLQGITFGPPSSQPGCASLTTYSDTPSAITWGSILQGGSANGYICVKNQGGTGTIYSVQTSVAPTTSGISITYNGTSTLASLPMANGQTSLINVVVTVALTASTGSFTYTTLIS